MSYFNENTQKFLSYLTLIAGAYIILWWIAELFRFIFEIFGIFVNHCCNGQKSKSLQQKYGKWAVITGATDGIGKQYAIELARKGMNVCLISRSETKLIEVANEIEHDHKVSTKFIVADFSKGKSIFEQIKFQLSKIDVGILINNVGVMHNFPDNFDQISEEALWDMINVNIGAATMMSRIVIPSMKIKNRGLILNVSSGAHCQPMPLAAVYAATKSYVRSFTIAISNELKPYKIKVHMLIPLFVRTNMTHFSTTPETGNMFFPNAETYVHAAIKRLGKYSQTCGYWNHSVQYILLNSIPECVRTFISHKVNNKFRQQYYNQQKVKQIL